MHNDFRCYFLETHLKCRFIPICYLPIKSNIQTLDIVKYVIQMHAIKIDMLTKCVISKLLIVYCLL